MFRISQVLSTALLLTLPVLGWSASQPDGRLAAEQKFAQTLEAFLKEAARKNIETPTQMEKELGLDALRQREKDGEDLDKMVSGRMASCIAVDSQFNRERDASLSFHEGNIRGQGI